MGPRGTVPPATEIRWATLRAWVCSYQETAAAWSKLAAVPATSTGSRCDGGLRKWAQPVKMQGNEQRVSLGPERAPHTVRSTTSVDDNRALHSKFRHLLQCQPSCRAQTSRTGLRQAFNNQWTFCPCWRAQTRIKLRLKASTEDESRSCEVCTNVLTMVAMQTSWHPFRHRLERRQRFHQILSDLKPHSDPHRNMWNVS